MNYIFLIILGLIVVISIFGKGNAREGLEVRDCKWGKWSKWGDCLGKCGIQPIQTRTREKIEEKMGTGEECEGKAIETRPCYGVEYEEACSPPLKSDLEIPPFSQLPTPPDSVSLLGGKRPSKPSFKPNSIQEEVYDKIKYWQEKKNTELVSKAIVVGDKLKKQREEEKDDATLGYDYSKPDLRMYPILKSIYASLQTLHGS